MVSCKPVEGTVPVAGGHFGRYTVGFVEWLCHHLRFIFNSICRERTSGSALEWASSQINKCDRTKKKTLTAVLGGSFIHLAGVAGRLPSAAWAVLLVGRGDAARRLLLVMKLILWDHVHLLAFQST